MFFIDFLPIMNLYVQNKYHLVTNEHLKSILQWTIPTFPTLILNVCVSQEYIFSLNAKFNEIMFI